MTIQLSLQEEVLLKYLYNPATDEFESLTTTLKDRFNLKDQVADASAAVQGTERGKCRSA